LLGGKYARNFSSSEALKRTRLVRKWQRKTVNLADHIITKADKWRERIN
jgi:hypothetical protein